MMYTYPTEHLIEIPTQHEFLNSFHIYDKYKNPISQNFVIYCYALQNHYWETLKQNNLMCKKYSWRRHISEYYEGIDAKYIIHSFYKYISKTDMAGLLVFNTDYTKILFVKNAESEKKIHGIPKGKIEHKDVDTFSAAMREGYEETGVDFSQFLINSKKNLIKMN